ncbi:LicD family protein [Treponema phagedenis]|nr:LicD family protein [Treponema phagedenis]TYT76512.1 hypothetical protein FS559_13655 [Treponema phagedenis]
MLARICNTDFKIDTYNEYNSGMGIFIDIYPLDVVSRNILKRFIISFKARFLTTLYVLKSKKHLVKKRNFFYTVSQYFLYFFSFFYSKKSIYKKQMQLVNISKNDHSDIVSCIVWSGGVFKYFYNKSDIETLIDWNFEDGSFKIPKNYDKILRSDYGNYMQLPPEKDRIPHHFYKVYRKEDL